MATFDLITEPWIPVMERGQPHEVGIAEALARAGEIDEVVDPSPLVTFALHRLLIGILHSAFRGPNKAQWSRWWAAEVWERDPVTAYLEMWRHRFDLFNPERPFYQTAGIESQPSPIQRLSHELGPANSDHFSHVRGDTAITFTPAQAVRYLLAYQVFSPGGLVGFQKGEVQDRSARGAPLLNTAGGIITGDNLAQTLLLNMVTYDQEDAPFPAFGDAPAWEQDAPARAEERLPHGYLDWLTWQSRRIRLVADGSAVRGVLIMKGAQLPKDTIEKDYEQMAAYRKVPKSAKGQAPFRPIGFRRDRAVWRDSLTLFTSTDGKSVGTVEQLGRRTEVTGWRPLDLFGVSTDQFNAEFWRHERLPLDPAYLRDRLLRERLEHALALAEASASALNRATRRMCEFLLSPQVDAGGRQPDREAVSAMVDQLAPGLRFWGRLEAHFDRFLHDQPRERTEDGRGESGYGKKALTEWANHVWDAAADSFRETADALGDSGWMLKAAAQGERGRRPSGGEQGERGLVGGLLAARKEAGIEGHRREVTA